MILQEDRLLAGVMSALLGLLTIAHPSPVATAPTAPSNLKAIPDYGANEVALSWADNSADETSFEIQRKVDAGAFAVLANVPANTTTYSDPGLATDKEYTYKVRAVNACGASAFSNEIRSNLKTIWPVPPSHEILHTWNDTIGTAGVDETGTATGFHAGVDIQRSGANNDIVAVRSGVVSDVMGGANGFVCITTKIGAGSEDVYQTNHATNPTVAKNDTVYAGQKVGEISETHFPVCFTDHTHYVITDAAFVPLQKHPLSIFSADADKDPKEKKPELFDHPGTQTGTAIYQQQGAASGTYLTVDATHPLEGDVDIIADMRDEMGTNPDQVPAKVKYWIQQPPPTCVVQFHDVRSATSPYFLVDWSQNYMGDAAMPLELSMKIMDYAQNHGPMIMEGGMTYPWPNYKNFYITNTKGTDGTAANVDDGQFWNTNAKDDMQPATVAHANYTGKPDTNKAREARFPDGTYTIHVLASDLIHADEDLSFQVRTENFCPIVCECMPQGQLPSGTTTSPGSVEFDEAMDTSVDPSSIVTIDNGATLKNVAWSGTRKITFTICNLADCKAYTLKVKGTNAKDQPGTPGNRLLDGNEDGTCGDDYQCAFSVAKPTGGECFLILGAASGASPLSGPTHTWTTQVSGIFATYPVTTTNLPGFALPAGLYRTGFVVQVLMWDDIQFPTTPERWSGGLYVDVDSTGNVTSLDYGTPYGLEVWAETYTQPTGGRYVRFPFKTVPITGTTQGQGNPSGGGTGR